MQPAPHHFVHPRVRRGRGGMVDASALGADGRPCRRLLPRVGSSPAARTNSIYLRTYSIGPHGAQVNTMVALGVLNDGCIGSYPAGSSHSCRRKVRMHDAVVCSPSSRSPVQRNAAWTVGGPPPNGGRTRHPQQPDRNVSEVPPKHPDLRSGLTLP